MCLIYGVPATIFIFLLGLFVIWKNPRLKVAQWWGAFSIVVATWVFPYTVSHTVTDLESAWIWMKWEASFIGFIPFLYIGFVIAALNKEKEIGWIRYVALAVAIILEPLWFSGLVFDPVPIYPFNFYFHLKPLVALHLTNLFFFSSLGLYLLWRAAWAESGNRKIQLTYIFAATFVGFLTGESSIPLGLGIPIPPYGMLLFWLYPLIITYAIIKHRLMDITVVVRKSIVYSITLGVVTAALFMGMYWIGARLATSVGHTSLFWSVLLVALLGFIFQPLRLVVERGVDRLFGKSRYEYLRALREIGDEIAREENITAALPTISNHVARVVGARSAVVYFVGEADPQSSH